MGVPLFPISSTHVEISSVPSEQSNRTGADRARSAGRNRTRTGSSRANALPFSALSNRPNRFGLPSFLADSLGEGDARKGVSLGNGGGNGFERGAKLMGVQGRIYEAVDAGLGYPEEFIDREIEGVVHADLAFTGKGKWLAAASRIKSGNSFLRVYIRRLLTKVLAKDFHTNFQEAFTLKATFLFERQRHVPINQGQQQLQIANRATPSATGPHLYFERTHHRWLPFELTAAGVDRPTLDGRPPGFRVGMGINVLPILGAGLSAFGELISPSPKVDPLEKYRIDPYWAAE